MTDDNPRRSRCTSIPLPGHPEAHFHVRGDHAPTAEDVAALQAIGKVLVERYDDVVGEVPLREPRVTIGKWSVRMGASSVDPYRDARHETASSGALISEDGLYRYRLWRWWEGGNGGCATFVMLNPSTADGTADDATIRKCRGFARRWGLSGLRVVNLFALRSTDPKELGRDFAYDGSLAPVTGPDNDMHLFYVLREPPAGCIDHRVVVAWGSTGGGAVAKMVRRRRIAVRKLMADLGVQPLCLGTAKDGNPRHPLMLSYDTPLVPWESP